MSPLFDIICSKCGEKEDDVIVNFTETVWDDDGNVLKESKEITEWRCKKCGGRKYKRLPSKVGGVIIK